MPQSVDVLGRRAERHSAFSPSILSGNDDPALSAIVREAAESLSTPIALVSLVLEEIQYFKAHHGLPPELVAARGTPRDVSFCQFAVERDAPFAVKDASIDPRVPKTLVRKYGIRSYLGIPIHARDTTVGTLCVMDVKPHAFTEADQARLQALAAQVDLRLEALSETASRQRMGLLRTAAEPAILELGQSIQAIKAAGAAGLLSVTALTSILRLLSYNAERDDASLETLRRTIATAAGALESCEESMIEVTTCAADLEDTQAALSKILAPPTRARLSEITIAGRELARYSFTGVGGAFLPELETNPLVSAPRPMAVAMISASISTLCDALRLKGSGCGVQMEIRLTPEWAVLRLWATDIEEIELTALAARLEGLLREDPTFRLEVSGAALDLHLALSPEGER